MNAMLMTVLDITEKEHESCEKNSSSPSEMFCSLTTLKALRLTINSAMALTEELLQHNYHTVLTGKMNQDPIEVLLHNLYLSIMKVSNYMICYVPNFRDFGELPDLLTTRQQHIPGFTSLGSYPCTTLQRQSLKREMWIMRTS